MTQPTQLSALFSTTLRIFVVRMQDLFVISVLASMLMALLGWLLFNVFLSDGAELIQFSQDTDGNVMDVEIDGGILAAMLVLVVVVMALWVIPVTLIADGELRGQPVDLITSLFAIPAMFPRVGLVQMAWTLLIFLGWLMFFIPGIYVFVRYWVVSVTAILEGRGDFQAFSRASDLTVGFRLNFAGILIIGGAALFMTHVIVMGILQSLGFSNAFVAFTASLLTQFIFTTGLFIFQTVSYHAGLAQNDGAV
jgi:hypothetical protein